MFYLMTANYFINKIDKIYDKLTIKKTKLINLNKKTYMTNNSVLSILLCPPTKTEIYNLIVTAKHSSPNPITHYPNPLPLTITKLIASKLAPLFKILIDDSLTY